MVKLRVKPVVGRVAGFASGRELGRHVIRVQSRLKITGMTGIALRRHRLKAAIRGPLVTGIAIDCRVRSSQRESVRVLLNRLNGNLPSPNRMTLLAIGPQLALVDVGVAILAALADARKNHLHVTLRARNGYVHSTKRIARLVMVELGNGTDRPPTVRGVAVLAGSRQTSVWAVRTSGGLRTRAGRKNGEHKYENKNQFRCDPSAH